MSRRDVDRRPTDDAPSLYTDLRSPRRELNGARPEALRWAAAAGELLLNLGAIERLLDGVLEHYAQGPGTDEMLQMSVERRSTFLEDRVRLAEPDIDRRAALLEMLGTMAAPFACRARLMSGRPRLVASATARSEHVDPNGFIEIERRSGREVVRERLELDALMTQAERSRELLRSVEGFCVELRGATR